MTERYWKCFLKERQYLMFFFSEVEGLLNHRSHGVVQSCKALICIQVDALTSHQGGNHVPSQHSAALFVCMPMEPKKLTRIYQSVLPGLPKRSTILTHSPDRYFEGQGIEYHKLIN